MNDALNKYSEVLLQLSTEMEMKEYLEILNEVQLLRLKGQNIKVHILSEN